MEQKRQYNLDLLRIFACFMVLILHVAGHNWGKVSPDSLEWHAFNFYDVLVRSAVPLFLMLSGKLFLSRDDISLKKLFSKNILKIVFVYLLWSFLYAVDKIGIRNIIASPDISLLFSVTVASKYHLWYLPALVSVYLLVPVFISMKPYKDGKILNYAAILTFIFTVVRYSVFLLPINASLKSLLEEINFPFDLYAGYFLFGYILDKYKDKLKKVHSIILVLTFFITVAATSLGSYYLSANAGEGVAVLYNSLFISTFIEAAIIFLLFLRLSVPPVGKTVSTVIKKASLYTFFVYLFHPFIIEHLDLWFEVDSLSFSPIISVPALSVLLFVLCMTVAMIIDRIPVVRRILM